MIDKYLEQVLNQALEDAQRRGHQFLTTEHVLLSIVNKEYGKKIIEGVGGDPTNVARFLDEYLNTLDSNSQLEEPPMQTIGLQRVLQTAILHLHSAEKKELDVSDILVAIFKEEDSHALYALEQEGITRLDIIDYISHPPDLDDREKNDQEAQKRKEDYFARRSSQKRREDYFARRGSQRRKEDEKDILERFTIDMCKEASEQKYDTLVGRQNELARTIEILARRRKNNPVLVGDSGTGKTTIVEGFANLLYKNEVPPLLQGYTLYSIDMTTLLSGTRFRGDFEERIKKVFSILEKKKSIVFVDEIHTIVGAGASMSSDLDATSFLKPLLARGSLRVIGTTTFDEYRRYFEKDRALTRRFQKIDVLESSVADTIKILKGIRNRYEAFHRVQYSNTALSAIAKLSDQYIHERSLPDKAIDVLDELGALTNIYKPNKVLINVTDVEKQVSKMTKMPIANKRKNEKEKLKNLEQKLNEVVFEQEEAIHSIATSVLRHHAGLSHPEKPIGSFLFVGPTGVGKTELSRQLAKELSAELIRFDMSEYMEAHSIARLLGSPPGYVGFDQGAQLTDSIRKHPNAVLLLDEIEKAHPDIFHSLLQVMDYGVLTDASGNKAHFNNVFLIMTSNAGSRDLNAYKIGFAGEERETGDPSTEVKNIFSPEFRNRLDGVVFFKALSQPAIEKIAQKFIDELNENLKDKKVELHISDLAMQYLTEKGYEPQFGARPMNRLIQEEIKNPLVNEILFGNLTEGGIFSVDTNFAQQLEDQKLTFSVQQHPKKVKKKTTVDEALTQDQ